jgi:hypothetical protein
MKADGAVARLLRRAVDDSYQSEPSLTVGLLHRLAA